MIISAFAAFMAITSPPPYDPPLPAGLAVYEYSPYSPMVFDTSDGSHLRNVESGKLWEIQFLVTDWDEFRYISGPQFSWGNHNVSVSVNPLASGTLKTEDYPLKNPAKTNVSDAVTKFTFKIYARQVVTEEEHTDTYYCDDLGGGSYGNSTHDQPCTPIGVTVTIKPKQ
jgi:hypothetical protein